MKLHLPNGLRKAVMACMAALTTLSTTIGTGIITGGAVTYMLAAQQAIASMTGWNNYGGWYYLIDNANGGSANWSDQNVDPVRLAADLDGITSTVTLVKIQENGTLEVSASKWQPNYRFASLNVENVEIENNGHGNLNVIAGHTVNIQQVSGTLSSVTNAGALTLGEDGGTINLSGSINNSGTLKLIGVFDIKSSGEYNQHIKDQGGLNGFVVYDGYTIIEGDNIDNSSATFKYNEELATLKDGKWLFTEEQTTSIYGIDEADSKVDSGEIDGETGYLITGKDAVLTISDVTKVSDFSDGIELDVGEGNAATIALGNGVSANADDITRTSGILNITVNSGAKLHLTTNTQSPNINGDLTINGGGTVISTTNDVFGWGDSRTKTLNMKGEIDNLATFNVGGRISLKTDINLRGYTQILDTTAEDVTGDNYKAAFDTLGGKIIATGTNNEIAISIREREALTIDVTNETDVLTITGKIWETDGGNTLNGKITKTGKGKLILNNEASHTSKVFTLEGGTTEFAKSFEAKEGLALKDTAQIIVSKDATLTVKGGFTTAATAGVTVAEGGTLTIDGGTPELSGQLTLAGTLNITGLDADTETYTDTNTNKDGYLTITYVLTDGGGSISAGATATVNGAAATALNVVDGQKLVATVADDSIFHVNSANYAYDATKVGTNHTGFHISETGELVISSTGTTLGAVTVDEGGKLVINNGGTVTLANAIGDASTLTGTGTVLVDNNTALSGIGEKLQGLGVEIAKGSSITIGGSDIVYGDYTVKGSLNFTSGDRFKHGGGTNRDYDSYTVTIDGGTMNINDQRQTIQNKVSLVLKNGTIQGAGDQYGGLDFQDLNTLQVSGTSTINSPIRIRSENSVGGSGLNIEIAEDSTLNFFGIKYKNDDTNAKGVLTLKGKGTAVLQGTAATDMAYLTNLAAATVEVKTLKLGDYSSLGYNTVNIATGSTLMLGSAANNSAEATLNMADGATLALSALHTDAASLTLNALKLDGGVKVDLTTVDSLAAGEYKLLAATGGDALDASKFSLDDSVLGMYNGTFSVAENVLMLKLAAKENAVIWTGSTTDNVWSGTDTNTPWVGVGSNDPKAFADSYYVNFTPDAAEGERTVTIKDMVAPAAISVTGTDWEWTGDGDINCTGALTVGDGTTASGLTISTTGTKTFTGGVTVNEGATLVVKNLDSWTGNVSGAGTLELNGVAAPTPSDAYTVLSKVIETSADGATLGTLVLSGGTVLDAKDADKTNLQNMFSHVDVVKVAAGACLATQTEIFSQNNAPELHLAGAGVTTSEQWTPAALSIRSNKTLYCDIELDDNATIRTGESVTGTLAGNIAFNGKQLTKIGAGTLQLNKAFTDAFNLDIKAGTVYLNGSGNEGPRSGTGSATIADKATLQIEGTSENGSGIKLTSLTMASGSTLYLDHAPVEIDALAASGSVVLKHKRPANSETMSISIHNVTGSGAIELTRWNDTHTAVQKIVLDGANTFSGNWKLSKFNTLVVSHLDALANATVELSCTVGDKTATLHLAAETIKLKGLKGSKGAISLSGLTNHYLVINTDAEKSYEYSGDFGDGLGYLNLVKDGAGTQSFIGDLNAFSGDITVNAGTLKLGTAQTIVKGRSVSIAAGATLGTALTLNGGSLTLDATGTTAASLGDNALTLGKGTGTTLALTVAGTEKTGTQLTLLGGISELLVLEATVGDDGLLGTLGEFFTLGAITDKSLTADTPAVADATGADSAWADRLGRSKLFYDKTSDVLYLKLAANILAADPLYWDPTADNGNGNWLGANWSAKDALGVDPGTMQNPWQGDKPVSVVFDGAVIDGDADVTIDTDAVVNDMTVKNGTYTYVKDGETGTLTIEGELTVEDTGSADISGMGSVSADSLDVAGTLVADELTVGDSATVTGSVAADTLTITDAATVDGGTLAVTNTLGAASMAATNGASVTADVIEITGTAEINGASVEGTNSLTANKIVISGDTASVTTGGLVVGEGGLSMTGGTLNSGTISGEGTAEISGGTVTIDNSTLSSTTVTGATFAGNSTLDGDADSVIYVGGVTVGDGAALSLNDATLTDQINVAEGGTLTIGGAMHLDTTAKDFGLVNTSTYAETADESDTGALIADGGDGFVSRNEVYTVITGDTDAATSTADWTVGADKLQGEYDNGKVTVSESKDTTTYWVNNNVTLSTVSDNFVDDTTTIKLNGGVLQMNENTDLDIVTNNENPHKTDSQISMGNDVTLEADKLTIADGTTVKLTGLSKAVLDLGDAAGVDENLTGLTEDTWAGTVTTAATAITDVAALGNAGSAVELTGAVDTTDLAMGDVGTVNATKSLTADSITGTGALEVDGLTTLKKGASSVGNAAFDGGLVLGGDEAAALTGADLTAASVELQKGSLAAETLTVGGAVTIADGSLEATALNVEGATTVGSEDADTASTLTVNGDAALTGGLELANGSTAVITGDLTLEDGAIKYNDLDSSVTAGALMDDTLALEVDTDLLKAAVDAGEDVTLLTLTQEASDAEISLNGGSNELAAYGEKYTYSLDWDDTGMNVTLDATANENYMKEKYSDGTPNGLAGAAIMDEAFANDTIATGGDLEKVLAAVDNNTMTDEGLAAVAGSSTAALGMALAGDVERQLRAIRNRTTTIGVNQCVVNEGMPYFNAWVNAEGNLAELDKDSTYAGYQLDSWGGTVGFDVDVNPNLTLGLAVTAMYGDLTVDGPDMLEGDLDTYYVTAFARYSKRAWTHTFIGTIGKMDGSYERTVNYAGGSYKTEGDTDGMAFGLMYEVGRVYALTEDGDACLQPVFNIAYRHTTVGGYTEDGGDAALDVDDQTLDTITLGAGARMQAVVGENLYNRTSVLELRALAKLDVGDRASEADVAFINGTGRATVESAELGAFGVELGAGLSIPVGDENDGTIFFDVSAELRSGYSNVNGTVGYRINF